MIKSADGVALALHDLGGTGPTLLYSHATGFHGRIWLPLARELGDRYHGWALDYRGHGDSALATDDPLRWSEFGADALAAVEAIDPSPRFGFGHSMGATALLMVELARPGTFTGLVLFEPIVMPPGFAEGVIGEDGLRRDHPLATAARRRRPSFPSFEAAYDNFAGKPPLNSLTPDSLHAYVDFGFRRVDDQTVTLKCTGETEARTFEAGRDHDVWERLDEISCPVLILGGHPSAGPGEIVHLLAEPLPYGRFQRFDHLSHFGPIEDPALVAETTAAFFSAGRP